MCGVNTLSLWLSAASKHRHGQLKGRIHVDTVVVGGGITGLTTALTLKRAGRSVAVLEQSRIGGGESGHTTSHLTEAVDARYEYLIASFGLETAQQVKEVSRSAIERIESWTLELGISCHFKRVPAYLYAENDVQAARLEREVQAWKRCGFSPGAVSEVPLAFKNRIRSAYRLNDQAQMHPVDYLEALAEAVHGGGCHVFENTPVSEIHEDDPCWVSSPLGEVIARDLVIATNTPISNRFMLHTKVHSYRSYALGFVVEPEDFPDAALFWDLEEPYHYIRTAESSTGEKLVILGGEDHKVGTEPDTRVRFRNLEKYARERFRVKSVHCRWSGQIMESIDGLPYIGLNPMSDKLYVATGYSGNGMTFGTAAGLLIADQILGCTNPWTSLFDPGRIRPLASASSFVRENLDFPRYWIRDHLAPAEVVDIEQIAAGEGKVIKVDGEKVAVFRDPEGGYRACSAICPHLGCQVHWNTAEKSWDCPCHGSRFDTCGRVLNGPAIQPLEPVEESKVTGKDDEAA